MPVVARVDPKTVFSAEEWRRLTSRSSLRGMWLVAHAWGTIAAAIALVALWPNPLTWLIAVMVVGTRQLGLAILMHEAAHGGLHGNKAINEWIGQWLCAVPVGADLASYRSYHLQHHKFTQQPEDPDLSLSAPFPITKESYRARRSATSPGRRLSNSACRCSCRCSSAPAADEEVSHESFVSSGADKMARFLVVNALLFGLFWLAGAGIWYWAVWVVAMATWLPLVTRIRNIAEHACTSTGEDPFSHARTTLRQPDRAPVDRALLGELPRRASSLHVSAVLPAARSASAAGGKGS